MRERNNGTLCNVAIDVVTSEFGESICMDNRRLYTVRKYEPLGQHLMVCQHNFSDPVPQNRVTTGAADILLLWDMVDLDSGEPEIHVIQAVLSY